MKRLFMVVMVILALFFISVGLAYSVDNFDKEQVKARIDPLLISEEYEYEILNVCGPTNNMIAVFINPSYRDFPNVILFIFNQDLEEYQRVYEGLGVGIQDAPSEKVDLHTLGLGVDIFAEVGSYTLEDETLRRLLEAGNSSGLVVIPYQGFFHLHGLNEEFYTIDKTRYYDFAIKLIGKVYENYPTDNCVMFDTPDLTEVQFIFDNEKYHVICRTDNRQLWTITFDGVDEENRFLVNKNIEVVVL